MSTMLYVAAKAPRIGFAKTRLGNSIGHAAATALYAAFLRDLGARFARAPFPVGWYVTPPDAWRDLDPLVGNGRQPQVIAQGDGDWTERQRRLFHGAAARGEERVVLVASDSPHLMVEVVADALEQLNQHDVVFGPVTDGGYYLIGMRGWHDIFGGVAMSTNAVLQDLINRADQMGLSVALVASTFDIDEVSDLPQLQQLVRERSDLPATRAALESLGPLE